LITSFEYVGGGGVLVVLVCEVFVEFEGGEVFFTFGSSESFT
jgi:hypothetical protein